jgi:hypothetical protein
MRRPVVAATGESYDEILRAIKKGITTTAWCAL